MSTTSHATLHNSTILTLFTNPSKANPMSTLQLQPTLFIFIFIFFTFIFTTINSSTPFVAPITRDDSTSLYTISLLFKTPLQPTTFLLDLSGKLTWIDCTHDSYTSTSHHYIPCKSNLCGSLGSLACSNCFRPVGPGCNNNSCGLFPENPVIGNSVLAQALVDSLGLSVVSDGRNVGDVGLVPNFVLSCSDESLLRGLPDGVAGLVGLGRGNYSLPTQVSTVYASPNLFAICLPGLASASSGAAFFNTGGPYYFFPGIDLSSHLIYTPLILNPIGFTIITYSGRPSDEYFINVTSININGHPVEFNRSLLTIDDNGFGGTRLSTVTPYTTLETSIYTAFIQAFVNESAALNLTVTDPVSPFEVCYAAGDVYSTPIGPAFPTVDIVMHSEDVFWRIMGVNSMVSVAREEGELWCLGFVDGGETPRSSVVIGGHQMEDNLLQFDLVSMRLGFSSSVLVHGTNCASFNFTSVS